MTYAYADIRAQAADDVRFWLNHYGRSGILRRHSGWLERNAATSLGFAGKARSVFQRAWHKAVREAGQ